MNKIKEATFSLAQVVPTGDYQNTKPLLSITFEGEDINFTEAWDKVHEELGIEVTRLQNNVTNSQNVPPPVPKAQNDRVVSEEKFCTIHNVPLEKKWSEKKKKSYFGHMGPDGMCFG